MYGHSIYTATKYALRGLAESLRFELLPYDIKVNFVCPGFTNTPLLDGGRNLAFWRTGYSRRICALWLR
jgi:NAD(P)-dependent dehydrogenase (short-subunit alcohol dehydrogenase family)